MGTARSGPIVMIAGGIGMLTGQIMLAKFPSSDTFHERAAIPPNWTRDSDLRITLLLILTLIGVAASLLRRYGTGRLVIVGVLAAGGLLTTLGDFGSGEPLWSRDDRSGDELVGGWLLVVSAIVVLLGVFWSSVRERPADVPSLRSYLVHGVPGARALDTSPAGMSVAPGDTAPDGWWLAADGLWYSPELRADANSATAPGPWLVQLWHWGRWVLLIGAVYGVLTLGQYLFVGDEARHGLDDDRGPVQAEQWSIDLDGFAPGVHTITMIRSFPIDESDVDDVSGRLVWPGTEVDLCRVAIRAVGDGFVQVGDILHTDEGCDDDRLQQAIDELGLPELACVVVRSDGVDDDYCAPLERR